MAGAGEGVGWEDLGRQRSRAQSVCQVRGSSQEIVAGEETAQWFDEGKVFWSLSLQWNNTNNTVKAIAIREAKRNNAAYRPHGLTALGEVAQARKDLNLMPEALNIVSRVLEEVLDDDEDRMDIDAGSGQKSK